MWRKVWLVSTLVACNAPGVEASPDPGPITTAASDPEKASDPRPAGDRAAVDPRSRVVRVGLVTLVSLERLRGGDAAQQADVEESFVGVPSIVKKCYKLSVDDDKGPAGRIVATFDITPSGGVENIEITGAFSDERPGECLRAALVIRRFSPRESATVASYRAVLELAPGPVREVPNIYLR